MTRPAPRIDPRNCSRTRRGCARWRGVSSATRRSRRRRAADDVAAIERPPPRGRAARAWMARVARTSRSTRDAPATTRAARGAAPRAMRRRRRRRGVARTEMFRVVVDAVLAREPIYRTCRAGGSSTIWNDGSRGADSTSRSRRRGRGSSVRSRRCANARRGVRRPPRVGRSCSSGRRPSRRRVAAAAGAVAFSEVR